MSVFLLMTLALPVHAISTQEALMRISADAPSAGVILANGNQNILMQNADKLFIPASVIKIPLVLSASDVLGEDFHWETEFYTDNKNNLLVRGTGDPFLISEEWRIIAQALKQQGYTQFNRLHLDNSLYAEVRMPGDGDSDNPYDAKLHSLFVNFNTVNLLLQSDGRVASAEEQTPTLPFMQSFAPKIKCCNVPQRINIGKNTRQSNLYTLELIHAVFAQNGITFQRPPETQNTGLSRKWRVLYSHKNTRTLEEVHRAMLQYSTNIIANAILLRLTKASRNLQKNALKIWRKHLADILTDKEMQELQLLEAAGLSRENRISPKAMRKILNQFVPLKDLLRFYPKHRALYKTGTLTGVCNAAGYLENGRAFAVFASSCPQRDSIIALLVELK